MATGSGVLLRAQLCLPLDADMSQGIRDAGKRGIQSKAIALLL
jgi:hypothetical protein